MYHNPNLPYPFSSRTCGRPVNQRPFPETDCASNPINPSNYKESPNCREQPGHREKPGYREHSICKEEPIQEKTCQPLKNTCIDPPLGSCGQGNVIPCTNSCNTSCNGNQLPFLLVMLYLFKINC